MATTSTRIAYLANGVRDTTGAVVASAKARFYNPGTLVAGVVYSDAACSTAYTQPVVCGAGGQATVYTLEAVRMIVKDTTDAITYYDDIVNLVRADSVYCTVAGINNGVETTLEDALGDLAVTQAGIGAINATDFDVVADGATDCTTELQDAIDYVEAIPGGRLALPTGTILISSTVTIDTAGTSIEGNGRGVSIIKNASTSGNALTINISGDTKLFLKNFSITASTTSSGTGIVITSGNKAVIQDVGVGLHRTGIDCSAVTGTDLRHCFIDSTDDNASAIGINLGAAARATRPEVTSGTDNGTGIKASGVDVRVFDAYVTNFVTAIHANAARTVIDSANISGPTTGVSLAAATGRLLKSYITGCTTGVSVGAVANCVVRDNIGATNTTDMAVNSSATIFSHSGNTFSTVTDASTAAFTSYRTGLSVTSSSSTSFTYTPDFSGGKAFNKLIMTSASAVAVTVAAAANTALMSPGDIVELLLLKQNSNTATPTINAIYRAQADGSTMNATPITSGTYNWYRMRWDGTNFVVMTQTLIAAV